MANLSILDNGITTSEFEIDATTVSREISTGEARRSLENPIRKSIAFIRNASPAAVILKDPEIKYEDEEGWRLADLIEIKPANSDDKIMK